MAGTKTKKTDYPMCGAKTRKNGRCKQHAMQNGRCAWHGGKSLSGVKHGRYKHGFYTKEFIELRKEYRRDIKLMKEYIRMMS